MAIDYNKMAAVATKLITANGRILQLVKFAASDNIDTPWKGSNPAPVASTLSKPGVVVASGTLMGTRMVSDDLLKTVSDVAYITADGDSLLGYDAIIDNGLQYRIMWTNALTPGPTTIPLIAFVGFNR
jgi:hypothetical protein